MAERNLHTYLFKTGLWHAEGEYFDERGRSYPVVGESRITHRNALWYNESEMKMFGSETIAFSNDYEIVPFPADRDVTSWTSTNDALGKLRGEYVLVGDASLSRYRSGGSEYEGTECLLRLGDGVYRNWGTLFHGGQKLSSWMVRLNRV